jgi:arsenite oxidase small subunit
MLFAKQAARARLESWETIDPEENAMGYEITRRQFLKASGAVAATAGVAAAAPAEAAPPVGSATLPYPKTALGTARSLKANSPKSFTYPDAASPCTLVKLGKPVPGGVGPEGDIVAYSNLCTHMGCPVAYDAQSRTFKCPCHFSTFDAELAGQMICGQATESLPRIQLSYNPKEDSIGAVGVIGLIYGRQSNVL